MGLGSVEVKLALKALQTVLIDVGLAMCVLSLRTVLRDLPTKAPRDLMNVKVLLRLQLMTTAPERMNTAVLGAGVHIGLNMTLTLVLCNRVTTRLDRPFEPVTNCIPILLCVCRLTTGTRKVPLRTHLVQTLNDASVPVTRLAKNVIEPFIGAHLTLSGSYIRSVCADLGHSEHGG